jgi:O-succinylbenzoic acid--CoA ligase
MQIVSVASRVVRWSIETGGAARGLTDRAALIIEVRTSSGVIGLGEAAPLPGMSPDTLDDAVRAAAALAARAPFDLVDRETAYQIAAAITPRVIDRRGPAFKPGPAAPAAQFAIETALCDALARERQISLAALLRVPADEVLTTATDAHMGARSRPACGEQESPHATKISLAAVVDDPEGARRAVAAGLRCLKIKVGPSGDLDRVFAIAGAAPGTSLRIDANRAWPRAEVTARLAALAQLPIDYVEEPCRDAHLLLSEPLARRLALDESLATLTPGELHAALASPALAAVVLKPTLLGGLSAALRLADLAHRSGVAAIASHGLEGPIGTAACAELAIAIGGSQPAGLATHPALAGWRVEVAQLAPDHVHPAAAPGLGFVDLELTSVARACSTRMEAAPEALAMADELSIADAARAAPDQIAIETASRSLTFAACAAAIEAAPPPPAAIVATPSIETVLAVHAALAAHRPVALIHHRLAAGEAQRQRTLALRAQLPADAAVVLFTSGSTGAARGVVLSRAALRAAADASARHLGWRDTDRWLLALSLAHAGGLSIVIRCLAARRPIVLCDRDFDRDLVAQLLERCTLASLVPAQLAALLDDPAWRPPAGLRAVLLGGAAAPPALRERAARRGVPFLATYGMTETLGQLATAPPDRAGEPDAPLVPLPAVVLEGGTPHAPGPIVVRAPMLATCYLDGTPIAPAFTTADLGHLAGGALHIAGRRDDVIITGGENVHPSTIEAVLATTPGVRAACVFGVRDERWGQVVAAALVVEPTFDARTATAYWHTALPAHARPRRLAICPALPVLPSGKVDRRTAALLPSAILDYGH